MWGRIRRVFTESTLEKGLAPRLGWLSEMAGSGKTGGWKICSRGHKHRGSGCPTCWKGNRSKTASRATRKARPTRRVR